MNQQSMAEELDRQIEALLEGKRTAGTESNPLLALASELLMLPDPDFKHELLEQLIDGSPVNGRDFACAPSRQRLPHPSRVSKEAPLSLPRGGDFQPEDREHLETAALVSGLAPLYSGKHSSLFPADHRSFLVSFASHAALIALIASGIFVGVHVNDIKPNLLTSELTFPAGHGGGGSGERSAIQATKGTPPKFSNEQMAPAVIVVRNERPKLTVDATVLGPPQIKLPESSHIGDLVSSNIVIPSNGTGTGGDAGDGSGTGLGRGDGAGVGAGEREGYGGGSPSRLGITAPRAIYDPEPEYSEEARRVKHQGIVVLSLVVDAQGHARDIHVARSLGMGLDEKAIEAVKKWKFAPATNNGTPVAMQVNVEVNFRLY